MKPTLEEYLRQCEAEEQKACEEIGRIMNEWRKRTKTLHRGEGRSRRTERYTNLKDLEAAAIKLRERTKHYYELYGDEGQST